MAVKIDYGLGCPFCEGSPEESTRPVKGGFQTRVVCDSCGCGTPWCNSSRRAWILWNNRLSPRPYRDVVAKIVRYDGLKLVDARSFNSEDSYRTALDECINSGGEFCGGSDEDGTHLTILRRCIC